MLKFLSIVNFAVIPQLRLEFHEGLNLLTGETGAGKSIIVDALNLLLGMRASTDVIRTGERTALVEGTFEPGTERVQRLRELLHAIGIPLATDEDVTIRRELQANGRSRIFVNDCSVTLATLRAMQPLLVEIHSQGEQQALITPRAQLRLLDAFGGCRALRLAVAALYARWRQLTEALSALVSDELERARTLDLLRFQLAELERLKPQPEEEEDLLAEKALLAHAEQVLELNARAYAALYEADDSVLAQLASVRRWLQELQSLDPRLTATVEAVEGASVALTDVAEGLRRYQEGLEFSPTRLSEVENRLAELERVKRKYGRGLKSLPEVAAELRTRLDELENWTEREQELQAELAAVAKDYAALAERLTACRRAAAPQLAARVLAELPHVALERARFSIRLETGRSQSDNGQPTAELAEEEGGGSFWGPNGADRVEFLLSANVGEEARPLHRVASGGELSRLMLVLRTVAQERTLAAQGAGATLVFDEIDAGIGGRVAEAVGRRLKTLAAGQQVLCVTHQPQIARFADHHYVVEKQVTEGRTVTSVREVEAEARVGELARMIGGTAEVGAARETARWLIDSARAGSTDGPGRSKPAARRRERRTDRSV